MRDKLERENRNSPACAAASGHDTSRSGAPRGRKSEAAPGGQVAYYSPLSYLRSLISSARGRLRWRAGRYQAPVGRPDYGWVAVRPLEAAQPPKAPAKGSGPSRRTTRVLTRGVLLALIASVAMVWSDRSSNRSSATVIVPAGVQRDFAALGGAASETARARAARPVYPLSVIPGGAYSVEELKRYLASDPVARQSFEAHARRTGDADLLDHLVVKRVGKPTKMYSQLRKGTKLCWTSRPVTVEEGESGFYDGAKGDLVARARCGNVMVVTLPAGAVRVPPPQVPPTPPSYAPPPSPAIGVMPEYGVRSVPQQQQQQSPPVAVPPAPVINNVIPPSIPPVAPPPVTPGVSVPPPMPPPTAPQQQQQTPSISVKGGDFPWWAGLLAGLGGGLLGRPDVNVNQHQNQNQHQWQKCKGVPPLPPCCPSPPPPPPAPPKPPPPDGTPEPIPEPGTILLMALGLGAAGALSAKRRRK